MRIKSPNFSLVKYAKILEYFLPLMHIIHNSDYTVYTILNVVSLYVKFYINEKLCLLHITLGVGHFFFICQYLSNMLFSFYAFQINYSKFLEP